MDDVTKVLGEMALENVESEYERMPNLVRVPIYFRDLHDLMEYTRALEKELEVRDN